MTFSTLKKEANKQLTLDNSGSYQNKKYRHFVIHKMIQDLFALKCAPLDWKELKLTHVQALIRHWKRKKMSPITMMKYMTVIRYFLNRINQPINGIDNQSLGLKRQKPRVQRVKKYVSGQSIDDKITYILFGLQLQCGLTRSEAMRLIPALHIQEHSLWITRDIAFNSHDRIIPICHEEQLHVLKSLCSIVKSEDNLISTYGYRALLHRYKVYLKQASINEKRTYRYLYAKLRFTDLCTALSSKEATLILLHEMGLKSYTTLWGYLNEQ